MQFVKVCDTQVQGYQPSLLTALSVGSRTPTAVDITFPTTTNKVIIEAMSISVAYLHRHTVCVRCRFVMTFDGPV